MNVNKNSSLHYRKYLQFALLLLAGFAFSSNALAGVIYSGVSVTGQNSGATGSWRYYYIRIPAGGATSVDIYTYSATSGDPDLYVRKGGVPTTSVNHGRSTRSGTATDHVRLTGLTANSWVYIGVRAFRPYRGMNVLARLNGVGTGGGCTAASGTFYNASAQRGMALPDLSTRYNHRYISSTTCTKRNVTFRVNITHTNVADLKVYLRAPNGTEYLVHRNQLNQYGNVRNLVRNYSVAVPRNVSIRGYWYAKVVDTRRYDTGTLNWWGVSF